MNLSEGASGGKHGKKTCNSSTSFAYKRKITLCISGAVYWICVATGGRSCVCVCIDFIFSAKFKCSLYSLISWVSRKRQLAVDKSARLCFHTLSSSGYDIAKKMDLTCHNAELCSLCLHIMSEVWFGSLTWWFFLFCNVRFCLLDVYLFFLYYLPPAPSASLVMIQRARSSTLRSTASTSWASTCQSTWASWWRRTRMLTRSSSPASSRMASPPIRQVLFLFFVNRQ